MQFPAVSRSLERSRESGPDLQELVDRARREGVHQMTVPVPRGSAFPMPGGGATGAIVAATLASLACGLGVLALAGGLAKVYYGSASRSWPTTSGEVIVNVGYAAMMYRQDSHNTVIFPPGFLYQYEVAGTKHVNSVRRFRSVGRGNEAQAQADAPEDLPVGTKVQFE
jgi:hypothetical protein